MGEKSEITGNSDTPTSPERTDDAGKQGRDESSAQDQDLKPEESREEIVIKQVPVDGICGGY